MRPAFIVTAHQSNEYRPNGHSLLDTYLETLYSNLQIDFDVFIIENGSETMYTNIPKTAHYRYFPDQNGGIVRAWNEGVRMAIENGNDMICVTNDDLIFNSTINNFFNSINSHEHKDISVYGPICDNPTTFAPQVSSKIDNKLVDITGYELPIHGWFMAFTKKYYDKFNNDGHIFDKERKWRRQEHFQDINWKKGAKSFVVHSCLVHHEHIGGWRKIENIINKNKL